MRLIKRVPLHFDFLLPLQLKIYKIIGCRAHANKVWAFVV